MLTVEEIQRFMDEDAASEKKRSARIGQKYYEAEHDIKKYRLFYYNTDGNLVEDIYRSNIKIPHPFFSELVDQAVQFILSGKGGIIRSDTPQLQTELDEYFNDNEDFMVELEELLTGCQTKGFEYMYAYKTGEDRLAFMCADSIGVIEVAARESLDGKDHVIYWYPDRAERGKRRVKRIQVWDERQTYYYRKEENGSIEKDPDARYNPKPHIIYQREDKDETYCQEFGFIPFFRMDNNRRQFSALKPVKPLIDDYDLMASSLSNNLADFDSPIHVVKGFEGDDLDELQHNLKTKRIIGMEATDEGAGVEIQTVDIPYEARRAKLELDEKNIYRFGFGLNMAGLKDTSATTNIAIKAAYSLLELKCSKLEIKLRQLLRKLVKAVLQEVNDRNGTDYQMKDIYFQFDHEILSNAQENSEIEKNHAETQAALINTLLNVATHLDNETLMQGICDALDLDYDDIKDRLPAPEDSRQEIEEAQERLNHAT